MDITSEFFPRTIDQQSVKADTLNLGADVKAYLNRGGVITCLDSRTSQEVVASNKANYDKYSKKWNNDVIALSKKENKVEFRGNKK